MEWYPRAVIKIEYRWFIIGNPFWFFTQTPAPPRFFGADKGREGELTKRFHTGGKLLYHYRAIYFDSSAPDYVYPAFLIYKYYINNNISNHPFPQGPLPIFTYLLLLEEQAINPVLAVRIPNSKPVSAQTAIF